MPTAKCAPALHKMTDSRRSPHRVQHACQLFTLAGLACNPFHGCNFGCLARTHGYPVLLSHAPRVCHFGKRNPT